MPPETAGANEPSSSSSNAGTQPTTSNPQHPQHPHHPPHIFRAFGPGGVVISGVLGEGGQESPSTGPTPVPNAGRGLDIGSLVNNVLSGIFSPGTPNAPAHHGHVHSHPPHTHGQQTSPQQPISQGGNQPQIVNIPLRFSSIHPNARNMLNVLTGPNQQQTVQSLERLNTLLESANNNRNITEQERLDIARERTVLLPNLVQLQRATTQLINSLNNRPTNATIPSPTSTNTAGPTVNGVNLHLHVNANELDQLPDQLQRVHTIINSSPMAPQHQIYEQPTSVTSTSSPITSTTASTNQSAPPTQQVQQQAPVGQTPNINNLLSQVSQGLGNIFGTPNQTTQPNVNANTTLTNFIQQSLGGLGVTRESDESEKDLFDHLVDIATQNMQITDMLALMSGNWAPLEPVKQRMRDYVVNDALKGDSSKESRQRRIEESVAHFEKYLDGNHDLQLEIASRTTTDGDLMTVITEFARYYLTLLLDIIIEEPSNYSQISGGLINGNVQNPFSSAISRFVMLSMGELVEIFETQCTPGSSAVLIPLLLESMMKNLTPNIQTFLRMQGSPIISNFATNKHREYKNEFPNRPISRLPKPDLAPKQQAQQTPSTAKEEVKRKEEKEGSSFDLNEADKMLDELMGDVNKPLPEQKVEVTEKQTKEEEVQANTNSVSPSTDSDRSTSPFGDEDKDDSWKNGLSAEEVADLENTISNDEALLELNDEPSQTPLSDAYKLVSFSQSQSNY